MPLLIVWAHLLVAAVGCHRSTSTPGAHAVDSATLSDIEGVWVLALTAEDERRLLIRQLALEDTIPTASQLESMGLNDTDQALLRQLHALPKDAAQRSSLAAEIAHFANGSLTINRRSMVLTVDDEQRNVQWRLLERTDNVLIVEFIEDGETTQGTLRLQDDGTLMLVDSHGSELILTRQ